MDRMERAEGLQVVLGAGGGTGRAIVDELASQGRHVRAVARREIVGLPAGVEQVRADRDFGLRGRDEGHGEEEA